MNYTTPVGSEEATHNDKHFQQFSLPGQTWPGVRCLIGAAKSGKADIKFDLLCRYVQSNDVYQSSAR